MGMFCPISVGKKESRKNGSSNGNEENLVTHSSVKDNRQEHTQTGDMNKSGLIIEDSFVVVDNTQFRK